MADGATGPAPILALDGVSKSFGDLAVVKSLDLAITPGECFALLGPNGAGKTTTLRLCLGLTSPDAGTITLGGLPVPDRGREARIRVGVVPQMDNLDPDFTVSENLLVFGRYFGLSDATIRGRIPSLLEFASLTSKHDAKIGALSGGMKRRLTLARSLVNDPDLIFMDEPTTGLDPQARHLIWDRLKSLRANGKTIVLTTHFMDEAERLADRLAVMDVGTKIAEGTPRALIAEHIEASVVEVYGDGARPWADARGGALSSRIEVSGETVFCYTDAPQPLLDELVHVADVRYLHRPANLEDVFLKLTGREMRD